MSDTSNDFKAKPWNNSTIAVQLALKMFSYHQYSYGIILFYVLVKQFASVPSIHSHPLAIENSVWSTNSNKS